MQRDSVDLIPSLREPDDWARGTPLPGKLPESPTLKLDPGLIAHLRSLASNLPSLASARSVRMYDPDAPAAKLEPTTVIDEYAELTIA